MTFSKTTAYSIRILTVLAQNKDKVVSVKTLHTQLELPFKYITKLMTSLSKKGFVKAKRKKIAFENLHFNHEDGKYRFPEKLHNEEKNPFNF